MYKKSISTLIILLIISVFCFGQETESVLASPDNWQREIIHFPLGFAQSIDFEGFEDLRFAPGWSDTSSQEFWTYMFVWYIEKDSAMTKSKLTKAFNSYYDGLMGVDHKNQADTSNQLDNTRCLFVKSDEGFTGEMRTYDRFFTKDYISLNIRVKETFCPKTNKQIIWCDISPKDFNHEVWGIFENVKLKVVCD